MELRFKFDCAEIVWSEVAGLLRTVGMAHYTAERHRQAFMNSHTVVFVFAGERLIGFGRAISDGTYQAAVYDVAIAPEYQRLGVGRSILEHIQKSLPACNFILYAAPGKEDFYTHLGFKKMRTGYALFLEPSIMQEKGFTE